MPPPSPEPKPAAFRFSARDVTLFLSAPSVVLVVLALSAAPGMVGAAMALMHQEAPALPPGPMDERWTAGTGSVASLSLMVVRGALPPPDPRQKRAPCDPEVGEEEFNGVCWIRLAVEKCNEKKAYPHNGKCYWRALRPAPLPREPTTGEPRPLGIADP